MPFRSAVFHAFLPVLASGFVATAVAQTSWSVSSPSGTVRGTVQLANLGGQAGYPSAERLYYSVDVNGPTFLEVMPPSPLGITRQDAAFVEGLVLDSASAPVVIDETYVMVTGKRRVNRNHAHERTLYFRNAGGARLNLVIRAYDDGFAFRYVFPEQNASMHTVTGETTGFRVVAGSTGWMMPQQPHGEFAPGYEDVYRQVTAGANSPNADGWTMPALFQSANGGWILFGETDVTPNYAGTRLQQSASNAVYRIRFPNANEGNGTGAVNPAWTLPWEMPWRFVVAGSHQGVILESNLPHHLATPSKVADVSWIKPGRSSWSWYSSESSPRNYNAMLPFYDLAQAMTWEYHLVDATWDRLAGGTIANLIAYGKARNVETLLWYNGGGPNNTLSPTDYGPRDKLWDSATRVAEFAMLQSMGVKGIKVDFFHSDKQNMMKYYHDLMRDAAQYQLMINFHGCTIQRGWQRTWPNLVTTESVRGAEMYKYDGSYPSAQPARNTMLPFIRNVMGGMDYTPVTFNNYNNAHQTSHAHQLALSVAFESGIVHFADNVAGYNNRPDSVKAFLRTVPSAWDDTRYLQGTPGTYLLVARRRGHDWWIAGLNGQSSARAVAQGLSFLGAGNYALLQLGDNTTTSFTTDTRAVTAADSLTANMLGRGGFVARLVRLDPPASLRGAVRRAMVPGGDTRVFDAAGRRLSPEQADAVPGLRARDAAGPR